MTACLLVMALVTCLFTLFVDLKPKVSPDFFFGSDDPELVQSARIHRLFPSDEFLIISVASRDIFSAHYYNALKIFSEDIAKIPGISRVVSVSTGPESVTRARESPFWDSLLISEDSKATLIIAFVDTPASTAMVEEVEAAARLFSDGETFHIRLSGMPYIVEQIRRSLIEDFKTFSTVSLVIFAAILLIVFKSPVIALGASASGITAIFLTLLILQSLGQPVGILTANLAVIVFVLVQSQAIYLTANWRRVKAENETAAVRSGLLQTFRASFWCMVTTLLGFATLLNVAAEPLRQLGAGGIVGAIVALLCGYILYPVFLLFADRKAREESGKAKSVKPSSLIRYGLGCCLLLVALSTIPGLFRLNTDPSLLTYFNMQTDLGEGLEYIDENGGSSPLKLVVRLKSGERFDTEAGYNAMWRLHNQLLAVDNVGTVISLPALLAEANTHPLAFLLPWREIVSLLSLGINDNVADNFLNEDRDQVLYLLRMKEGGRDEARNDVIAELHEITVAEGFKPVLTGGVYMLQGRLSALVSQSLITGLTGLLLLFAAIAWIVSRNWRVSVAMTLTAALIPLTILGGTGWFGVPVDIISAPAASVCFGIAVDALIHLAFALRRHGYTTNRHTAWKPAFGEQSMGIVASSGIIVIGFLIFASSAFPPTARFGGEIVLGALFSGAAALTVFPMLTRFLETVTRRA
ncbi:MAG: MMPL family transporter [Sneathiella sp.]